MALSKGISISVFLFIFTATTYADNQTAFNTSVLPPGAKVVPGDLSKGEFFILAQNEAAKAKPLPPVEEAVSKEPFVPSVRSALSKTISAKPTPAPVVSITESTQMVEKAMPSKAKQTAQLQVPSKPLDSSALEKKLKPIIKSALNKTSRATQHYQIRHAERVGNSYRYTPHAHDHHAKSLKVKMNKKLVSHSKLNISKSVMQHIDKRKEIAKSN